MKNIIILSVAFLLFKQEYLDFKPIVIKRLPDKVVEKKIVYYDAVLTGYDNCKKCTSSGRGITASGVRASRGTIAVPTSIEFGTKINIINAPSNVHPYRVAEDRGGAIKVKNGTYHFDLWFETHEEALKFGRRKAKIYFDNNQIYIIME